MKEGKRAVGDRRVEEGTVRRKETNETTPPHDRKKNNDTLTFDKYNLNKVSILTISDQKLKCMSWFLASTKTLNLQTYYTEKGFSVAEAKATGLLCWWLSNAGIISSYPTLIAKKNSFYALQFNIVPGSFREDLLLGTSRTHHKLDSC